MIRRLLLPAVAAVLLLLASCGGDSGPSKDEFIEEADAICAEGLEQTQRLVATSFSNPQLPTAEEVLALVQQLVALNRDTVAEVRSLEMPEGDEDEINALLDMADQALDEASTVQDPRQAVAMVQSADTPQDPFYATNQAFARYGFDECSE